MKDIILLIDSGHGGFINGVYQTDPKIGKFHEFPSGEVAYEGQINRLIKECIISAITQAGLKVIDVCPTELDLDLSTRCAIINSVVAQYGSQRCLMISQHSNAGGGTGAEIWTSPGKTLSDYYATEYMKSFKRFFPTIHIREDKTDGDVDKESNFYMLVNTVCPAILPEFLFFDNASDWNILKNSATHIIYAKMIVDFIKRVSI
jgi:N-acetylmuramoyl-L-alanine amidase